MAVNSYELGDIVRLSQVFTDLNGNQTDPSTVTLKIKTPDKKVQVFTRAAFQIIKDGTGLYHFDYHTAMPGLHVYRYEGAGIVQSADEEMFAVKHSKVIIFVSTGSSNLSGQLNFSLSSNSNLLPGVL